MGYARGGLDIESLLACLTSVVGLTAQAVRILTGHTHLVRVEVETWGHTLLTDLTHVARALEALALRAGGTVAVGVEEGPVLAPLTLVGFFTEQAPFRALLAVSSTQGIGL